MVNEKMSDEARYREAVHAMECGDERAKTRVAFYKLSGRGGAEVDADEAVALLEERVKDKDDEAMWMLGLCCEFGTGTEQNIERAESLYWQSGEVLKANTSLLKLNLSGVYKDFRLRERNHIYREQAIKLEMKDAKC